MHIPLRKLFLTSIIFFNSSILLAQFEGGDGSEAEPYQIATIEQLQEVSAYTSAHFVQIADVNANSTKEWNEGKGFQPIDNFSGVYDGNNFSIDGLYIDRPDEKRVGLFRIVRDNGNLKNIKGFNLHITGEDMVGGLVGLNFGTVVYSFVDGMLYGVSGVGGVIGQNADSGIIEYTSSNSTVKATRSGSGVLVGGNRGLIQNSYSYGKNLSNEYSKGSLAGYNTGTIIKCYASDELIVSDAGTVGGISREVGGFVGNSEEGTFESNYYNQETTGENFPIGKYTTSVGITGVSDFEMMDISTFSDWDFDSIWNIQSTDTLSYPYLKENPQNPKPGFSFVASFDTVAQNSSKKVLVDIVNPFDKPVTIEDFEVVSKTSWRWSDGVPDNITIENGLRGTINVNDSKSFSIEWTPNSQEKDLEIVIRLITDSESFNKNYSKVALSGVVKNEAEEGKILIITPNPDQRFLVADTVEMSANTGMDNIQDSDICWSSDLDGNLGCGNNIEVHNLSKGNHIITVSVNEAEQTESIRVFEDLWELYQAKPADSEVQAIQNDFNIVYKNPDDLADSWDNYSFHFDHDSPEPSKLKIISILDVMKRQRFTKRPVFIKDYDTVYDWFKGVVHTIYLRLDCGYISGGYGIINIPRTYNNWKAANSSEDNCGEPLGSYNDFPSPYTGMLGVLMHEARHSEPEDPQHYRCENGWVGDEFLENGGGYAWNALYSMWIYKFSKYDPPFLREDYGGNSARSIAKTQLEFICGEGEPKHSEPYIQNIIDEILNEQTTVDDPNRTPISFTLDQNHPNPFYSTTNIPFTVPNSSEISLKVFDILGREVAVLIDNRMKAGNHIVTFDAKNLASGVYLYRLKAEDNVKEKQMLLIK